MLKKMIIFKLFTILALFIFVSSASGKWEVIRKDDFVRDDGIEGDLQDVCFVDEKTGWAVGANGLILKTIDGGKSWAKQEPEKPEQEPERRGPSRRRRAVTFWSVNFRDKNEGFITGSSGAVLYTKDGGETWKRSEVDSRRRLLSLCMSDKKNGFVVGENNTRLKTTDGGMTWEAINPGDRVRVGESRNNLEAVFFATQKLGWIVGSYGTMLRTKDHGKTWTEQEVDVTNNLFSIYFIDDKDGWIAGQEGVILHTADAGQNWEVQETKDIYDNLLKITFVNKKVGWAVGVYGTVVHTTDGGKTWKKIEACNANLNSCSAVKPNHCWAVGDWGIIIKYIPD